MTTISDLRIVFVILNEVKNLALQLSRSFAGAQDDKKSAQDDKQKRSGWQMQALRMTNHGAKNDTQSYKTILPAG